MATLVMKFGGAAVEKPESFERCAKIICDRKKQFTKVVAVVSAMKGVTDQLIDLAKAVNPFPSPRELDMLLSVGERISMSLLAMALEKLGQKAASFTGSQTGIITSSTHSEAKILDVRPYRLLPHLEKGEVVIVAGFQGVSREKEITTLGRGGSDTTAVALALALTAEKVEFYKDVDGIYSDDPKVFPEASRHSSLSYQEARSISLKGCGVLHERALLLAEANQMPLQLRSFQLYPTSLGTEIGVSSFTPSSPCYEGEEEVVKNLL